MNTVEVRDLVSAYLTEFGVGNVGRIPRAIIDNQVNFEAQVHFRKTKSLHGYWHTLYREALNEYTLPEAVYSPYNIKVAGERYYPATYPYIDDAKTSSTSRTRITEEGNKVSSVRGRWYWINGRTLTIYPSPIEDTGIKTSGNCTILGSIVTIGTGTLGNTNSLRKRLILIGSSYFVILTHSSSDIVVDGTPDSTQTTYTIYEQGIEIEGIKNATALTIGQTLDMEGDDIDGNCIAVKAAYNIALMKKKKDQSDVIDLQGLMGLYRELTGRAQHDAHNLHPTPKTITPFTFRRDHAGMK